MRKKKKVPFLGFISITRANILQLRARRIAPQCRSKLISFTSFLWSEMLGQFKGSQLAICVCKCRKECWDEKRGKDEESMQHLRRWVSTGSPHFFESWNNNFQINTSIYLYIYSLREYEWVQNPLGANFSNMGTSNARIFPQRNFITIPIKARELQHFLRVQQLFLAP